VSLASASAIRNQGYTLLEAITPTYLTPDKFRRYRNEGSADFQAWAEKNPTACIRRFQIRQVGTDDLPTVSDTTTERVTLQLEIRIAYPQTERFGNANAMSRDDVLNEDWRAINYRIGLYGRGNFTGAYDCTPLGATMDMEHSVGVDYMVVLARFEYVRAIA
jgi:hypothetical protein